MEYYEKNKWKFNLAFAAYFIVLLICWYMPSLMGWYDTILGEQGLKNVISIVRISFVTGCLLSLPLLVMVFFAAMAVFTERKIAGILIFISGTALLAALTLSVSSSICHFNVQCRQR